MANGKNKWREGKPVLRGDEGTEPRSLCKGQTHEKRVCKCADVGILAGPTAERSCQMVGRREPHPSGNVSRAGQRCFRYGQCAEGIYRHGKKCDTWRFWTGCSESAGWSTLCWWRWEMQVSEVFFVFFLSFIIKYSFLYLT